MINLIIFASSAYPILVLEAIKKDGRFNIKLIITRPDRPVGRKQILTPNPVKLWAQENNIEVATPETLARKDLTSLKEKIIQINPDLGLVAHFGLKIPSELFLLPKKETLNIHFSLLPKYRGGAPLEHTIINGDTETGITILKLTEDFDAGDIIYQEIVLLQGHETVNLLYKSLFEKTSQIISQVLSDYVAGKIKLTPQDKSKIIYAYKKDLGDGKIDWKKTPAELERYIRALNPNPGTWTEVNLGNKAPASTAKRGEQGTSNKLSENTRRLKILKAHLENEKLVIDEVQLEGKTPTPYSQFQKSYPEIQIGTFL